MTLSEQSEWFSPFCLRTYSCFLGFDCKMTSESDDEYFKWLSKNFVENVQVATDMYAAGVSTYIQQQGHSRNSSSMESCSAPMVHSPNESSSELQEVKDALKEAQEQIREKTAVINLLRTTLKLYKAINTKYSVKK